LAQGPGISATRRHPETKTLRTNLIRNLSRVGVASLAAAVVLVPTPALAGRTQESILQDDPQVLGASASRLDEYMGLLKSIGVDRLRVSVLWSNIAPARDSQVKPAFPAPGPAFPQSYPSNAWRPYDNIVLSARKHRLGLIFTLTGPSPAWATPGAHEREGIFRPSTRDFREFVTAVGARYSGRYPVDDRFPQEPKGGAPIAVGPVAVGGGEPAGQVPRLPRVTAWSVWNEPNYPSWLRPIWLENNPRRARDMVAAAPHHYRGLVDAAWAGLSDSTHEGDLILIGETSARGAKRPSQLGDAMAPAEFTRELYCLKADLTPYAGRDARIRGCPADAAERRAFRRLHPGLFKAAGFAHHPYSLDRSGWRVPTWRPRLKDNVPIGNLNHLLRTLDGATAHWRSQEKPMPIWITEYGYQTRPPDPLVGVTPARQGPLSSWGEYLAYRNPRVASIAQFLAVDDGPVPGFSGRDPRRWISWQSGLYTEDRRPKPSLQDYLRPIHTSQRGRAVQVFGGYRQAATGVPLFARIEYSGRNGAWLRLRSLTVRNRRGYFSTGVRVPRAGLLRIRWRNPVNGAMIASRSVSVR